MVLFILLLNGRVQKLLIVERAREKERVRDKEGEKHSKIEIT